MSVIKKIYSFIFTLAAMAILAVACTDDKLEPDMPGPDDLLEDGYYLTFKISLQSMQTRATDLNDFYKPSYVESYEDYIHSQRLYIMFFKQNEQGKDILIKKFYTGDRQQQLSFIPVRADDDRDTYKSWYVRIPISELEDGEAFARELRENDFKIAVIANADPNKEIVIDKDDPIENLHHQTKTDTVGGSGMDPYGNNKDRYETYGFLYNNDWSAVMGHYTDWVTSRKDELDTQKKALAWIRENWDPSLDKNVPGKQYRRYSDLWFLWNFGGDDPTNQNGKPNAIKYDYFSDKWEARNGANLRAWITKKGNGNDINDFNVTPEDKNDGANPNDINYLTFKTMTGAKAIVEDAGNGQYYYGVLLPPNNKNVGVTGGNYTRISKDDDGYFSFTARACGTLFITARKANGATQNVKLFAQNGYTQTKQQITVKANHNEVPVTYSCKIDMTGDEQVIYIFNDHFNSAAVEIFQIEFVQDSYLYYTDRVGVAPSEDFPIPMYGIQSFPKLKGYWEPGTLFDLTNFSNMGASGYAYNDIPLLRSVAKIELRIPSNLNPDFVFLRCANRTARWEPVDISTNTREIWKDHIQDYVNQHSHECEWFHIRGHKPFYEKTTNFDPTEDSQGNITGYDAEFADYQQKLAWYYGTWAPGYKPKTTTINPDGTKTVTPATTSGLTLNGVTVPALNACNDSWRDPVEATFDHTDYPHVMNAMINRSDFTEFIDAGTDGIYKKYVLYVPEKYVDDPNNIGKSRQMEQENPKVIHIEFRANGDPFSNLDDNNCYRIYFIEDGFNKEMNYPTFQTGSNGVEDDDWEHSYEQQPENLRKHWPIIRNHKYAFTVKDVDSRYVIVKLEVLPWKLVDDISVEW